jgi:hypothetical protein
MQFLQKESITQKREKGSQQIINVAKIIPSL